MSSLKLMEICNQLGLSGEESQIYEHILTYGPTNISDLSKRVGLKRSTLYLRINELSRRGFLKFSTMGRRVFVSLGSPKVLKESIKKEKDALKNKELLINQIVPFLKKTNKEANSRFTTEYLSGIDGFKSVIDKIISENKDLYWLGSFEKILGVLGDDEFFRLMTWRRMDQKTTSYAITDNSILSYPKYMESIGKFRDIKIIKSVENEQAVFVAFGDYLATADLSQGIHIVLNKSKAMSNMFKKAHLLMRSSGVKNVVLE